MPSYPTAAPRVNKDANSLDELYGEKPKLKPSMSPYVSDQFEKMHLANNPKAKEYKDRATELKMEALETQNRILKMKVDHSRAETLGLHPNKDIRQDEFRLLEPKLQGLYKALDNPKPKMVVSSNSLAARKAAEERKKEELLKAAQEKKKADEDLKKYEKIILERRKEAARAAKE